MTATSLPTMRLLLLLLFCLWSWLSWPAILVEARTPYDTSTSSSSRNSNDRADSYFFDDDDDDNDDEEEDDKYEQEFASVFGRTPDYNEVKEEINFFSNKQKTSQTEPEIITNPQSQQQQSQSQRQSWEEEDDNDNMNSKEEAAAATSPNYPKSAPSRKREYSEDTSDATNNTENYSAGYSGQQQQSSEQSYDNSPVSLEYDYSTNIDPNYSETLDQQNSQYAQQQQQAPPNHPEKRLLVIGVDGGTESIRVCCFDATTGEVVGHACASPYPTYHPHPGWAEQDPRDWYNGLSQAVRQAMESLFFPSHYQVAAICMDTTCCSVVALDMNQEPLRPCLLWMDQRSAPQTKEIVQRARGDPALNVNGQTSLSAEWLTPKALWLYQNEYETTWSKAHTICEYQDYLNYKLTGIMTSSACNVATRWHWNAAEATVGSTHSNYHAEYPGRPLSMYQKIGLVDLPQKLPRSCLSMGQMVGYLTQQAAVDLGLPVNLPVIQGGPDAFVGMVGLGCIGSGIAHKPQLCLITGSSHLHCLVVPASDGQTGAASGKSGMWGPYQSAPLPGLAFAEGGQSSTGSLLKWAKSKLFDDRSSYAEMDKMAAGIPPGSNGLLALETFQGSRTPVTDPLARGALVGLTLSHTKAHIWRALMEGVCFGTRACLDALESSTGQTCEEIVLAGGITRSKLWLQMHADITNKPIKVYGPNHNAPLLGCAILASVGVGIHPDVETAVQAMLPRPQMIMPNPKAVAEYNKIYQRLYSRLASTVRPIFHAMNDVREGIDGTSPKVSQQPLHLGRPNPTGNIQNALPPVQSQPSPLVVSPSLLACDFGNIREEVERCMDAGAHRFHVDIFDGVSLDSPIAFTFGPDMVRTIAKVANRKAASMGGGGVPPSLDLHMCVVDPERFVEPMGIVGASRFIFQWETVTKGRRPKKAMALAEKIVQHKMQVGVSVNPETSIKDIKPLLKTGLVSVVDILAVRPGFGGQQFQAQILEKVAYLREWRDRKGLAFDIMVDGGVSGQTAPAIKAAGANVLVSGSFLFKHPNGIRGGLDEIVYS